ncbi:IS110 family transposase [Xanthomonas theicola]|uniref:IS110 family transposase n=1 Tax=Xanthomonas theicola TaxID=56464 RepID=UPI001FE41DB7|nr:IS110 family transposase [Xanthomonas theicola]
MIVIIHPMEQSMSPVVGIDVAQRSFDLAIDLANGQHRTKAGPPNEQVLHAWLQAHAQAHSGIVMEATGTYHQALAEFVHGPGCRGYVLNPAPMALYVCSQPSRVKRCQADRQRRHASPEQLRSWQPDPPVLKQLKALVRRRDDLQQMWHRERNRLDVAALVVRDWLLERIGQLQVPIAGTDRAGRTGHRRPDRPSPLARAARTAGEHRSDRRHGRGIDAGRTWQRGALRPCLGGPPPSPD